MLEALSFYLQIRQCHVPVELKTEKQYYGDDLKPFILFSNIVPNFGIKYHHTLCHVHTR